MKKKTLRKQIASMYLAWSTERDDYKSENTQLKVDIAAAERKVVAWQLEAMTLKRELQSVSERRS